jgi:protein-L-isoaspartate(D-aspartate) O-methyltransferase
MQRPVLDYSDARNMMVDGQVRPNRVYDPRILDAMRRLPRERFVPPSRIAMAYADADVPLNGRVLLAPTVIARLVQLAGAQPGERVLVVGSGSGYGAALFAACGATVTALEEDPDLRELARDALRGITEITPVEGKLRDGWPGGAPYDVIFFEGGAAEVPAALAAQLRAPAPGGSPAGRLVAVLTEGPHVGRAVLGERVGESLRLQPAFDCTARLLPGLRAEPRFDF